MNKRLLLWLWVMGLLFGIIFLIIFFSHVSVKKVEGRILGGAVVQEVTVTQNYDENFDFALLLESENSMLIIGGPYPNVVIPVSLNESGLPLTCGKEEQESLVEEICPGD